MTMLRPLLLPLAAGCLPVLVSALLAQSPAPLTLPLRGPTPLDQIAPAPRMTPMRNTSEKEVRNYPEQPPVIPHSIEGYQIDLNGNKCLTCHARSRTGESQAPMISVTHFMDRDGQFLATVSPRRFFCTECHVPQHEVKAPVANDFVDIDTLLARAAPGGPRR
jgi:cytochrome c-type protein NapB